MRKLLLGTTALAAAGAMLTNAAIADVSISGYYEWVYNSRSSTQNSGATSLDGTSFGSDSEIVMKFSNNNQSKASRVLGINRTTLRTKLKKYNIK